MNDVTEILSLIDAGDHGAAHRLLPVVYEELRKLAKHRLAMEKAGQTLTPTGLVHEAFVRLVDVKRAQDFGSRGHFFAAAAEAMRRIMIESARRKQAQKRSGHRLDVDTDGVAWHEDSTPEELIAVDEVLDRLSQRDPEAADLVKLRVFSGFSVDEAAQLLGMARTSAYRTWRFAKAWLSAEMGKT